MILPSDSNAPTEARIEVAPAAGTLRRSLLVIGAAGVTRVPCPPSGTLIIGRGADADVRIDDVKASRRHALLHLVPGERGTTLEDCGSLNATQLGAHALSAGERAPLSFGERFTIGTTTLILVEEHVEPEPEPPSHRPSDYERRMAPALERVAAGDINVLVLGETGVGKEVLARSIHQRSPRANKPLVCLNCAALSESLLESELFGHEKGAFTGATQVKIGLLESAEGGTVFLDEIGEMPLSLQAKLLRVLEQREVQRVGSLRPRPIDVRFVAATNRDLEREIEAGRFRQDLYFRLNGIALTIPPLRERLDELEPLALGFIEQASARTRRGRPRLSQGALEVLRGHRWPGNIRELRNVIERAVLLCGDVITPHDLPAQLLPGALDKRRAPSAQDDTVTGVEPIGDPPKAGAVSAIEVGAARPVDERERIVAALAAHDGNQTKAAKALGISRRTLISRIEEYDLPRPRKRSDEA